MMISINEKNYNEIVRQGIKLESNDINEVLDLILFDNIFKLDKKEVIEYEI